MSKKIVVGVLSFQGGVAEHVSAVRKAALALAVDCEVREVKRKGEFFDLDGLLLPGGESTVIGKLLTRFELWDEVRAVPAIFGTCAGAIMLAKKVIGQEEGGQKFLELMDIKADRNAYGSQIDSFEQELDTKLGRVNAVFIRAPKIKAIAGSGCETLASLPNGEQIAIAQKKGERFYLAVSFHPELSTTKFHEYFLRQLLSPK
jgi:5'-phosphate synthase pdxT subunit